MDKEFKEFKEKHSLLFECMDHEVVLTIKSIIQYVEDCNLKGMNKYEDRSFNKVWARVNLGNTSEADYALIYDDIMYVSDYIKGASLYYTERMNGEIYEYNTIRARNLYIKFKLVERSNVNIHKEDITGCEFKDEEEEERNPPLVYDKVQIIDISNDYI